MGDTNIEWADKTWSPITGCTPISEGCANCYAKRMAETRLRGRCGYPEDEPFRPGVVHYNQWEKPLRWKNPRKVFVCSMGDLFHDSVIEPAIDKVLAIVASAPQHTFMLLTKRPERMRSYLTDGHNRKFAVAKLAFTGMHQVKPMKAFRGMGENPLPNLWLGVTAENQARADERIPVLLQIPAAKRFVSIEPMLAPVDLTKMPNGTFPPYNSLRKWTDGKRTTGLDWVICGGETGPGARPMNPDWARSVRDQCQVAEVPFFFKKPSGGGQPPADLMVREVPE